MTNAVKYCESEVKKFDLNSYMVGHYMPPETRAYYFGNHALFMEVLKSREVSKEPSICQTRLRWWEATLADIVRSESKDDFTPREPLAVVLQHAKLHSSMNFNLHQRLVDFQLYDIERGDMQSITELEIYGENTRSLMIYLNLHLLKIDDSNALTAASHIGRCLGMCDVIKKMPYYLGVHRGYLPHDILLKVSKDLII